MLGIACVVGVACLVLLVLHVMLWMSLLLQLFHVMLQMCSVIVMDSPPLPSVCMFVCIDTGGCSPRV